MCADKTESAGPPGLDGVCAAPCAGYWLGGMYIASSWIEAMLLQYGAGLPVAYGRVSPDLLYKLMALHIYYRAVNDRGYVTEQRGQTNRFAAASRNRSAPQASQHEPDASISAVVSGSVC